MTTEKKLDNIYVYLWEDLKAVYVGRTVNPKSRDYAHRKRENEATYKFSKENNVQHPEMLIIESSLPVDVGIEREKYWIKHYRENTTYNVLNITIGGQPGKRKIYTKEEIKEHRKSYYLRNKDILTKYQKEYYKENKGKIKEYFDSHKEVLSDKIKEYKLAHRDELLEKHREYNKLHRIEILEKSKEYYDSNKEKYKLYYEANKEKIKEYQKRYRDTHKKR